jgi:nucleoside-diphosphate-sugar epimerase
MAKKKALVIGGLGVIGRRLVQHLSDLPDWDTVAVSRRAPDFESRAKFISADLLDRADAKAKLGGLDDVTHIFYAALDGGLRAENVERNLALLVNPVEAVEPVAGNLQRIVLMQGGKAYGRHIGPFKTPARESDPRYMTPNFYYDQEDFLRERVQGKAWSWTALRPEAVGGFALGNPLNLILLIGVYAAVLRELGLPFRFPGKPGAYHALTQMTDSELLAHSSVWAATSGNCANEVYNVTNGDTFRWSSLWPRLADFFGMDMAQPQPLTLATAMRDKAPAWDRVVRRYNLKPAPYDEMATWEFGDFIFHTDWDVILSDGKRFRHGFTETVDSEERMLETLARFRAERVIP